ncbi:MAG: heme NO-binding domain-containing protein [Acidimicrobiia bacterium]|nr:heme NO-binding domain-containing protein [Acidimicrobiia bacterium]
MKGVVFNVVEEVVTELHGGDAWDDVLVAAGLDGAYTALGNYDDDELLAIVDAAATATGITVEELWRTVGRLALPKLVDRLPESMKQTGDAKSFLLSVNDFIHPQVRALYPEARPPVFEFTERGDELLVVYRSTRRLDALAEGLMVGCGDLFGEVVDVEAVPDCGRPDDEATFSIRVGRGAP